MRRRAFFAGAMLLLGSPLSSGGQSSFSGCCAADWGASPSSRTRRIRACRRCVGPWRCHDVTRADTIPAAFVGAAAQRAEAIVVLRRAKLPSMFASRGDVIAGGLVSYGRDFISSFRRAAACVDKILKGAKPSDLPVERASTFELVINRNTANALGLTVPPTLLLQANQVID